MKDGISLSTSIFNVVTVPAFLLYLSCLDEDGTYLDRLLWWNISRACLCDYLI